MASKILKVSRIYKTPAPAPEAPKMADTAGTPRRNAPSAVARRTGSWKCALCGETHGPGMRWYRHRRHSRASAAYQSTRTEKGSKVPAVLVCAKCAKHIFLCGVCGGWHHAKVSESTQVTIPTRPLKATSREAASEHRVCKGCSEKHWYTCSDCGIVAVKPAAYTRTDDGGTVYNYCNRCEANFAKCDGCGQRFSPGNISEVGPYKICSACRPEFTPSCLSHSNKPEGHFYTERPGIEAYLLKPRSSELYLGVELEIDDGKYAQRLCKSLTTYPHLYLKLDGSLSELGIEVVSHPGTLEAHKQMFHWDKVLTLCKKYEYRSYDATRSCGLHIHMSRAYLDRRFATVEADRASGVSATMLKLMGFVYSNGAAYTALAQRENKQYAAMHAVSRPRHLNPQTDVGMNATLKPDGRGNRYQALNFCNKHTVEWRLFRGTLNHASLMACLELVDATTNFILASGVGRLLDKAHSWAHFCQYVQDNGKRYTFLKDYMIDRKVWKLQ